MEQAKRIFREHICRLCGAAIGDTGMCNFKCDNDFVLVRDRPQGSVIERKFEMVLIEEREV